MKRNLLHGTWSADEIEQILRRHARVSVLPPMATEAWLRLGGNPIAERIFRRVREAARREMAEPLPTLTPELYQSFRRTGHRIAFEAVYFERRRRLGRAALSLLLCGADGAEREGLTRSLVEKFTDIFEEVSWALPAHVHWDDNANMSGIDPMQIDLFCAETANQMAEMLNLFGAVLPAELQARVRERLDRAIFRNFVENHEKFHWPKVTHNWNAVCHQGVIGAALSQLEDVPLLARMLQLAGESLPLFLSGFTEDGGCSEGVGYWSYGFGWFTFLNQQLETRTGGELSLFAGDEKVRAIARFGPRMQLAGGKMVNFADGSSEGEMNAMLLAYLGRELDEASAVEEAGRIYGELAEQGLEIGTTRCDVFYLTRLCFWCPESVPTKKAAPTPDCFLPDLAVTVAHATDAAGHRWDFAAKGGHNGEHHNHNDCGSYLLNVDGRRLVAEIGAPEYEKDFFGPKRYEFLAARSLGHSLPVINGCEQGAGEAFASQVISHRLTEEAVELEIDLTACYPAEAGCGRYVRKFRFDKRAVELTVTDEFELSRTDSLEGALIAIYPVEISGAEAVIQAPGLKLVAQAGEGARWDRVETHGYSAHSGKPAEIQRLVLRPEVLAAQVRLGVTLRLG